MINVRSCLLLTTRSRHQRQPSLPSLSLFVMYCMAILSFWPFVLNLSNQTKARWVFFSCMIVLVFCVNIVKDTCINHKALVCCDTVFYLHDRLAKLFVFGFSSISLCLSYLHSDLCGHSPPSVYIQEYFSQYFNCFSQVNV